MTVGWSVKILVDKKDLSMGDIGATLSIPGIFVIPNDQVIFNAILICTYLKVTWLMKGLFCFGPWTFISHSLYQMALYSYVKCKS